MDRGDIFKVHEKIGHKFCLSGGIPNFILSYGSPDDVRKYCKKVIDGVAGDGGYIIDAGAIMQNDTKTENLKAMTDFAREYGVYSSSSSTIVKNIQKASFSVKTKGIRSFQDSKIKPGVCIPWENKIKELPEITGDCELVKKVWEDIDALGNMFIWQCLLSF